MRGLERCSVVREQEQVPDPMFEGPEGGRKLGVVSGGLGSRSLVQAVKCLGSYQTALVEGIAWSALEQCDALVLTERRRPASLTKQRCWTIWDWVGAGGRLLLTHDAVGYRDHPILFPWVCSGGTAHVTGGAIDVVWTPNGTEPPGLVTPSYPEHILLQPCIRAKMTVIALDAGSRKPVVTGAAFERGRVLACGLALGAGPDGADVELNLGEMKLLDVMLAWLLPASELAEVTP